MAPNGEEERAEVAVVIASALSHESEARRPDASLLELGGQSVICHVVWQLNAAMVKKVVVVTGYKGKEVKASVDKMMHDDPNVFVGLEVSFVELGEDFSGDHAASIVASSKHFIDLKQVMLVGADHIVDDELLLNMARTPLGDDAACVLVETDLKGMVGVPANTIKVALRPLESSDRIFGIDSRLEGAYGGIDAGVVTCGREVIEELKALAAADAKTATLAAAMQKFAAGGKLRMQETNGKMWFTVETPEVAALSRKGIEDIGHPFTLADGSVVHVIGTPKVTQASGQKDTGGEWAEFCVDKWRSAMFTARSFFLQLFDDTTDFCVDAMEMRGGAKDVLLIDIGCGTGEAMGPLVDSAKYLIGIDFNPHFIDFANKILPDSQKHKVKFLTGDAQELEKILADPNQVDPAWVKDTVKVVTCLGNTMGIMPPEVRVNSYKQMKLVAGHDGCMICVYWNGNKFGDALQNFYHKNPQLCGKFTGECIDLEGTCLNTPSGYSTHWTKPEEARYNYETLAEAEVIDLVEKGNGVLISGRLPGGPPIDGTGGMRAARKAARMGEQLRLPKPESFLRGIEPEQLRSYREGNLRFRLGSPWGSKGEVSAIGSDVQNMHLVPERSPSKK